MESITDAFSVSGSGPRANELTVTRVMHALSGQSERGAVGDGLAARRARPVGRLTPT